MVEISEGFLDGASGRVFRRVWSPDSEPNRIVQIVHGYAEHLGRYEHVADALVADGAVVCAEDHTGHGRSDGERALIADFALLVDDIALVGDEVRRCHPGLPFFMAGHSMGGLLSALAAQRLSDDCAGVAFFGAVIGDWEWARDVLLEPELPTVEFDPLALSRDPTVGAAYAADPLAYHGQYKRALLEAEVAALDRYATAVDRLTMPILFVHGTDDPFVPYERSLAAVRAMPTRDLTVHLVDGGRHEVLNEVERDDVIGWLVDWTRRIAGLSARSHTGDTGLG